MLPHKPFSRRNVLVASAAALMGPSLLVDGQSPKSEATKLAAKDREINIFTNSNEGFSTKMERYFPGLQEDANFATIAPLAALVHHRSGPPIRAYSICWAVESSTNSYETALFRYASPHAKRTKGKGRTIASAQLNLLDEGGCRLVTPFFTLSPKAYGKAPTGWYSHMVPGEPGSFLASEMLAGAKVRVWMDAAVFQDRHVIGQDKHRLAKRLHCRRHAEHDEACNVLKLLLSGTSNQEVMATLFEHGTADRTSDTGPADWYLQSRKRYAKILLTDFQFMGRTKFTKMLLSVKAMHRTRLKKLVG